MNEETIAGAMPVELSAPGAHATQLAARNKLVIGLLLVSTFVVILNETIMGVALPHLMVSLDIPATSAQWLTTAFMLTMAVVIPITGFLIERFNTRPIFIVAMSFFSAGTLMAALSTGFTMLLFARVVQACGTAIMLPLLMTTVMTLVPANSRGRTMGNISIVISVAPAIGPTISGIILGSLDWRWMFILVLPIAVAALILGAVRVKNVTTPQKVPLDVLSVILSAFGFGGLVFGLSNIGGAAGSTILVEGWTALAVGVVALIAFALRQFVLQRRDRALLDLRTFKVRTFTASIIMLALSMLAFFGAIVTLPLYMQNVLGLSTLTTGLLLLPGGLMMGLLSPFVGRIYDRSGPKVLLIPGAVIVSVDFWLMTMMNQYTSPLWVLAAHVTLSIGLALIFTPLFSAGLGSLQPHLYSHGSAIVGTVQQVAGAAGTTLFITVMSAHAAILEASGSSQVAATASGIQAAFMYGAIISMFAIVAAFFIRKPPAEIEDFSPVDVTSSEEGVDAR